jgi:hypothetical protein
MTPTDREFVLPEGPPVPGNVTEREWLPIRIRDEVFGNVYLADSTRGHLSAEDAARQPGRPGRSDGGDGRSGPPAPWSKPLTLDGRTGDPDGTRSSH